MELLAGLAVTRKSVERHAEAVGEDIARQCSHKLRSIQRAGPCAMSPPLPTPERLQCPKSSAVVSTPKHGNAAGAGPKRKSFSATEPSGSGTSPTGSFPAPYRSWIYIMPANTSGIWRGGCSQTRKTIVHQLRSFLTPTPGNCRRASDRGRVFRTQCRPHAISTVPQAEALRRLGRD
jgi:hypothetical protein